MNFSIKYTQVKKCLKYGNPYFEKRYNEVLEKMLNNLKVFTQLKSDQDFVIKKGIK